MPNYSYMCNACNAYTDHHCKHEDRPDTFPCETCGEPAKYTLIPPGIMTHSYLDGQSRKGYKDLREASKLNVLASRTDNQAEKAALNKEIAKTGHKFTKEK